MTMNNAMLEWALVTRAMARKSSKLNLLSSQDMEKCKAYLDKHFDAQINKGAAGTKADDYSPALDGKPAQISDVVDALLPLTLFGSFRSPLLADSLKETMSELWDLVSARYDTIVAGKISKDSSGASAGAGSVNLTIPEKVIKLSWEEFLEGISNTSVSAQWNALHTKHGPVPPSMQYNLNLTMNAFLLPGVSRDSWTLKFGDQWQFGATANSSGPRANDQETLNIAHFQLDLDKLSDKLQIHATLEASVGAVAQGLLFGSRQGGGQAQVQVNKSVGDKGKEIFFNITGQAMGDKTGWNFTLAGMVGVNFH
jgi:hypothetical protein